MNQRFSRAILGATDGVTSIAGVVSGAAAAGVAAHAIAVTALGGAFAATVSMAGAEWNSESDTDWEAVGLMGCGTLVGAGLPALPLLGLAGLAGWIGVSGVAVVLALVIAITRALETHRSFVGSFVRTFGVLIVGSAVGFIAGRWV